MKRWLPFLGPFVAVFLGGVIAMVALKGCGGRTPPADVPWVAWADLDAETPYVRTSGTAHYGVVVTQHVPGNLIRDAETTYLYPLMAPGDVTERRVRVFVRSHQAPEELVSFEGMAVEGWLSRATPDLAGYDVEVALGRTSEYFFADDMLFLDAVVVEEGLDDRATLVVPPSR